MRQRDHAFRHIHHGAAGQFIFYSGIDRCKAHKGGRRFREGAVCLERLFSSIIDFARIGIIHLISCHAENSLYTDDLDNLPGVCIRHILTS